MFNFKYLVGGAALVLATSALAGGPEQAPVMAQAPAANNSGVYINANGGLNLITNAAPYSTAGFNVGGALGYHFSNNFRLEVASNYWRHGINSNNQIPGATIAFQMVTVMGNAYYDFDLGNSFVPYIGAGLGWAHQWQSVSANNFNFSIARNLFAFQGIVGVDYKISDNVRLGVSYHAVGFAGNDNFNNNFRISRNLENQFNLGLSYYF